VIMTSLLGCNVRSPATFRSSQHEIRKEEVARRDACLWFLAWLALRHRIWREYGISKRGEFLADYMGLCPRS
jgi:hypothetical protein